MPQVWGQGSFVQHILSWEINQCGLTLQQRRREKPPQQEKENRYGETKRTLHGSW